MKTVAGMLVVAALMFACGCARTDWIDRTLVTMDVTGTWSGSARGGAPGQQGGILWFELEQQGPTVKGTLQYVGSTHPDLPSTSRPINGTVAGDVFRFRQRDSNVEGELTVSGDEMTGQIWFAGYRRLVLRCVDPSSRPPR